MDTAIITFQGFNELDSFIAAGILNRMKGKGWNIRITCPEDRVTSMNGVTITAQEPLEFAATADIVLIGSGIYTRDIANDPALLSRLNLDPVRQFIGAQCSGTLILAKLGLLNGLPACTDLTTAPWVKEMGVDILDQPFVAHNKLATAGGCMASQYLAAWAIAATAGMKAAEEAIHYVAPVGEKTQSVNHMQQIIRPFLT